MTTQEIKTKIETETGLKVSIKIRLIIRDIKLGENFTIQFTRIMKRN